MGAARRSFLKSLAAAPLLPVALAQTAPNPPRPSPAPTPAASPSPSDTPSPMAESLADAARHRFGAFFEPGDLDEIRKAIHGNLQAADRLHQAKLTNADEPVTMFTAQPPGPTPREQPAPRPMRPSRR
jgi:hypothetical protein